MNRYRGEPLPQDAKIAILANDALGNFAVATPLAQQFRSDCPGATVDFYGGERTRELEEASVGLLYDYRASLLGAPFGEAVKAALERNAAIGGYDLTVNIEIGGAHKALAAVLGAKWTCGPSIEPNGRGDWAFPDDLRGDLWRDPAWVAEDLSKRYTFLGSGFIGEIFSRLAYREGPLPPYLFPSEAPGASTPDILISTGASLESKLWPVEKWEQLIRQLPSKPGLLGAPPKRQQQFYHTQDSEQELVDQGLVVDLRGKLTLPQVVGALAQARLVVTIDNGILHFAAASAVPTVGLYRRDIWRLWAPPNPNLRVVTPDQGDVSSITVEQVAEALGSLGQNAPLP